MTLTLIYPNDLETCAAACASDSSCRCFNYNNTGQNCNLFSLEPTTSVSSLPSTPQGYQLMRYPLTKLWPTVSPANCSLPFTKDGSLYYGCRLSFYQNEVTCPRWGCPLPNGTEAICQPPYDFKALNGTTNVVLGPSETPSNVTLKSIFGWLIVQQRVSNDLQFERTWNDYVNGFSDTNGDNFWLGLAKIGQLTSSSVGYSRLRIEMYSALRNKWYSVEYSSFKLDANYAAIISGYIGDAGNAFTSPSPISFSSYDNATNNAAAVSYRGGWWYGSTSTSYVLGNLNGAYTIPSGTSTKTGFFWSPLSGSQGNSPPSTSAPANSDPGALQISRMMLRN